MEKEFIAWLTEQYPTNDRRVVFGIGDDAAVLNIGQNQLVVTTDSIADGVHFDSSIHNLEQIGWKAIGVNFSDVAAMGAWPLAVTVNFICPRDFRLEDLQQLFGGMKRMADRFETPIVGGDTNRWDGKLVVGATVIGTAVEQPKTGFWKMFGGQPGDWILVSGSLGGSITDQHIAFEPRLELARHLIQNYFIHAATDITDSLAIDLSAIAIKSHCGFRIMEDRIPVSQAALEMAKSGERTPLEHALFDGEDFELIICAPPDVATGILGDDRIGSQLSHIGQLTDGDQFEICAMQNSPPRLLEIRGYVH